MQALFLNLKKRIGLAVLLSWTVCFSGCATVSSTGVHQSLLVRSEPPGAKIVVNDKIVDRTPAYVTIPRGPHPSITVIDDDGSMQIPLHRRYRWGGSFAWNCLLYIGAPIGWAVDLISGAAWEADNPPPIAVHLRRSISPPQTVAIAPPQTKSPGVSDAGGEAIEQTLRGISHEAIRPYNDTARTFLSHGYDFDGRSSEGARPDLYAALGVRSIYESTAEYKDEGIVLNVKKTGIYDGTSTDAFSLNLKPDGQFESVFTSRSWWARLIPNTGALTFTEQKISIQNGDKSYPLTAAGDRSWYDSGLTYLSTLDITNTLPLRAGRAGRWTFGFVPVLRLSRQVVQATGLLDQGEGANEIFTRWRVETGYGPEAGYQFGRHYFYFDLLPYGFWNQISWDENSQSRSITKTGIDIGTEFGYIALFGDHWVFKLFTRTDDEDADGWVEALHNRLPVENGNTLRAQLAVFGVSFGYRIEPEFSSRRFQRNTPPPQPL